MRDEEKLHQQIKADLLARAVDRKVCAFRNRTLLLELGEKVWPIRFTTMAMSI